MLSNATIDMKIFREETFGPAMPLFRFRDDEEAIQLANNTEYGLAAYFFTKVLLPPCRPSLPFAPFVIPLSTSIPPRLARASERSKEVLRHVCLEQREDSSLRVHGIHASRQLVCSAAGWM